VAEAPPDEPRRAGDARVRAERQLDARPVRAARLERVGHAEGRQRHAVRAHDAVLLLDVRPHARDLVPQHRRRPEDEPLRGRRRPADDAVAPLLGFAPPTLRLLGRRRQRHAAQLDARAAALGPITIQRRRDLAVPAGEGQREAVVDDLGVVRVGDELGAVLGQHDALVEAAHPRVVRARVEERIHHIVHRPLERRGAGARGRRVALERRERRARRAGRGPVDGGRRRCCRYGEQRGRAHRATRSIIDRRRGAALQPLCQAHS